MKLQVLMFYQDDPKKRYEETNIDVIRLEKPPKDYF